MKGGVVADDLRPCVAAMAARVDEREFGRQMVRVDDLECAQAVEQRLIDDLRFATLHPVDDPMSDGRDVVEDVGAVQPVEQRLRGAGRIHRADRLLAFPLVTTVRVGERGLSAADPIDLPVDQPLQGLVVAVDGEADAR